MKLIFDRMHSTKELEVWQHIALLESRDLVSGSIFVSFGLGHKGFRSRLRLEDFWSQSQAYWFETLITTKIWLRKTLQFTCSLFAASAGKKQSK